MEFTEETSIIFQANTGLVYTLDRGVVMSVEVLSVAEVGIFTNIPGDDSELCYSQPCGYIQVDDLFYPIILGKSQFYGGYLNNLFLFLFNVSNVETTNDVIIALSLPNKEATLLVELMDKMNLLNVLMLKKKNKSKVDAIFEKHDMMYHPSGPVNPTVERISRGLVSGAFAFSSLAVKGASFCQSAIQQMGEKALAEAKLHPVKKSHVNPHLRRTLHCAKVATKALVTVTAAVVKKTSKVSARVLKTLIKKGAATVVIKRLPAKWKDSAFLLGSSALVSSGIAIHGIESAVFTVGKSVYSVTTDVVKARHGIEAGKVAADALGAAGSTVLLWHNLSNFTVRSFAEKGAQCIVSDDKSGDGIQVGDCIEIQP